MSKVYCLQLRAPGHDFHRLVLFKSKDKGQCKQMMRRLMKSNDTTASQYMICRYQS